MPPSDAVHLSNCPHLLHQLIQQKGRSRKADFTNRYVRFASNWTKKGFVTHCTVFTLNASWQTKEESIKEPFSPQQGPELQKLVPQPSLQEVAAFEFILYAISGGVTIRSPPNSHSFEHRFDLSSRQTSSTSLILLPSQGSFWSHIF